MTITRAAVTCDSCNNLSTLTTKYDGKEEEWCESCWEHYGGWVCHTCNEFLPIRAFWDFEYDDCIVCCQSGRASNFEEYL